jgi:hypothetical protein
VIVTAIVEKPAFLEFVHKNVSVQEIVKMDLIVLVELVEMAVWLIMIVLPMMLASTVNAQILVKAP